MANQPVPIPPDQIQQATVHVLGQQAITATELSIPAKLNVSSMAALRKEVTGWKKPVASITRGGNDQASGENQNIRTASRDLSNVRCFGYKEVGHITRNGPSRNATDARVTKLEATIAAPDLSALKNQGN